MFPAVRASKIAKWVIVPQLPPSAVNSIAPSLEVGPDAEPPDADAKLMSSRAYPLPDTSLPLASSAQKLLEGPGCKQVLRSW